MFRQLTRKLVLASWAARAICDVPILLTTAPFTATASAPVMTRSISLMNERTAESTIKFVFIPALLRARIVTSPWFLGLTSVANTQISFPCRSASMMHDNAASELQWVRIVSPSRIWRAPNFAILSTASREELMNSSAFRRIAVLAPATVSSPAIASITICTALGRDTAVGRVLTSDSAADSISSRKPLISGVFKVSAWPARASTAARAIRPAPLISMLFIFSRVSVRTIELHSFKDS